MAHKMTLLENGLRAHERGDFRWWESRLSPKARRKFWAQFNRAVNGGIRRFITAFESLGSAFEGAANAINGFLRTYRG